MGYVKQSLFDQIIGIKNLSDDTIKILKLLIATRKIADLKKRIDDEIKDIQEELGDLQEEFEQLKDELKYASTQRIVINVDPFRNISFRIVKRT